MQSERTRHREIGKEYRTEGSQGVKSGQLQDYGLDEISGRARIGKDESLKHRDPVSA